MKQQDITWFRPLWRRIAVTVFVAFWCAWEWYNDDIFWGFLTAAALVYAIANFFVTFPKHTSGNDDPQA